MVAKEEYVNAPEHMINNIEAEKGRERIKDVKGHPLVSLSQLPFQSSIGNPP